MGVPTIYVLSKNKKNIKNFHLKINIFTAVKYCSILHGQFCVIVFRVERVSSIHGGGYIRPYQDKCYDGPAWYVKVYVPFFTNNKPSCKHVRAM